MHSVAQQKINESRNDNKKENDIKTKSRAARLQEAFDPATAHLVTARSFVWIRSYLCVMMHCKL